jgi:hypothetical protein
VPVLLRLPDLGREASAQLPTAAAGSTRPWVGIAMWCATGVLAVLAAVLIFTGKPESAPPSDEAPQWKSERGGAGTDRTSINGTAGGASLPAQAVEGNAGAPAFDASGRRSADQSSVDQAGSPSWPARGPVAEPAAASPRQDFAPAGSLPPSIGPGGVSAGGPMRGNAAEGNSLPAGGPREPTANPSQPTGLSDPWPPEGQPPDQSKLQTGLRTAVRPNAVRLGGDIGKYEARPSDDISR